MKSVDTLSRLTRAVTPFTPSAVGERRFQASASAGPSAEVLRCERWSESSLGDPLHKLILVVSGRVDIEGGSGGWLIIPGHLIFVPTGRPFNLATGEATVVTVVHLDPADAAWEHEGCWVAPSTPLAREMISYAVQVAARHPPSASAARQYFCTLSHLCRDWFSNPRMLFMPAARSETMRAVVRYIRDHLTDATVAGACTVSLLPQRTLHRHCLQEFGFGLRTLIREVRTMRAMELLAAGEHSVQSVARNVGFVSAGSFTSAFTERLGISPSDFMRKNRSAADGAPAVRSE